MMLINIISILVVVINITLGLWVLLRRPKGLVNLSFFGLMATVSGWVLCNWLSNFFKDYELASNVARVLFFFPTLIVYFFVIFVSVFPKRLPLPRAILIILTGITLFFGLLSLTNLVVKDVVIVDIRTINDFVYGDWYIPFGVYIIAYFILGYYLLFRQLRRSSGIERKKIQYLFVSFVIATIFGLFTNLLYPTLITGGAESQYFIISPYGPLFTVFIGILLTYSIIRYRFMDISLAIRKSAIYLLTLSVTMFVYVYLLLLIQKNAVSQFNVSDTTTLLVLVLLVALTVEPLRKLVVTFVDKYLSLDPNVAKEEQNIRTMVATTRQFDQLAKKLESHLAERLGVNRVAFMRVNPTTGKLEGEGDAFGALEPTDPLFHYLQDQQEIVITDELPYRIEELTNGKAEMLKRVMERLKKLGIGLAMPVGEKGDLLGAFFCSRRDNKEAFTTDDIEYLHTLQPEITAAVANALFYQQAVNRITVAS